MTVASKGLVMLPIDTSEGSDTAAKEQKKRDPQALSETNDNVGPEASDDVGFCAFRSKDEESKDPVAAETTNRRQKRHPSQKH